MILGTGLITLALAFYTIGVWSERLAGRLKGRHLIFFWLGLICDTTATTIMMDYAGAWRANLHGLSGVAAILLMITHAVWATIVWLRKDKRALVQFHKLSILVWAIWLIPYSSGIVMGMRR